MNKIQLPIFILLALFITASFADVYKWTDNKGVVHYTQYKPLNFKSELVKGKAPPPASDSRDLNKAYAEQIDQRGKQRQEQQAASKASSSKSDFNAQQCDTAKKNLAALQAGGRVSYVDASGQSITMSAEEMQSRVGEANKQIEFYCQ